MLTRLVKGQIVAFVVLTVTLLTYAGVVYAKLPQHFGIGRHTLYVELASTGNLYERAIVTLRGQSIGEVTGMSLTENGVRAVLSVEDEAQIPKNSRVTVRSVSGIGEQYLNFEPAADSGPRYGTGDVVPPTAVRTPVDVNDLVRDVNRLVASLPAEDLNTTFDELAAGFSGTGDNLGRLLDSSRLLLDSAQDNVEPTRRLIDDLRPVLTTQRRLAPEIHSIAGDLSTVTGQLRRSDGDLRGAIEKSAPLADELDKLVNQLQPILPTLLSDLTDTAQILRVYLPSVRHTIVVLPATLNALASSGYNTPQQGAAKLNFKFVLNDPPPCTLGFDGAHQRNPEDLRIARPSPDTYCKEPHGSPIGVRMGHNDPCPNDAAIRSRTAAGCGLNFQSPGDAKRSSDEAIDHMLDVAGNQPKTAPKPQCAPPPDPGGVDADGTYSFPRTCGDEATSPTTYDQGTGMVQAPDGQPYLLGTQPVSGHSAGAPTNGDWRGLLLNPMGLSGR